MYLYLVCSDFFYCLFLHSLSIIGKKNKNPEAGEEGSATKPNTIKCVNVGLIFDLSQLQSKTFENKPFTYLI